MPTPTHQREKIAVIGLGYVGLPLALLAERKGYSVVGIDVDANKVTLLKNKKSPFLEEKLEEYLAHAEHISFSSDFSDLRGASLVIICVPTPVHHNHMPDLTPVIGATEGVATHLEKGQMVILESTVNPGVSEEVVLPILEKSGLKGGVDFHLAHCPERINPGDARWNVENINRVVGSLDAEGLAKASAFYRNIITGSVMEMGSLKEAEAVKVVENSFRDINIAFVNELAQSFTKLGIDVVRVIDGAATKPFAFMAHYPSRGVGGHCIPVDPYYLIEYAKENGFHHDFLSLARRINNGMPAFTIARLEDALNEVRLPMRGTEIALLGVSYKPDIDDCRESPSFELLRLLKEKGANVRVFDPFVPKHSTVGSLDEALEGAQAVVLSTAHTVFKALDPVACVAHGVQVVVDGMNCLRKEVFTEERIIYKGIGR
ncbi:MAG: nucleotide sugar dehydrogenase [Candidatus Pacebacteria bacterium]|nr:nucleotide sugar dehydrogenase [Candidatus Paceibacterota bacterium]